MASRSLVSLRALPARTTTNTTTTVLTPSTRPVLPTATPVTAHQAASYSSKTGGAPHMTPATEAWIAKLKETHGFRWQAVYEESRARQARNAELIQEKHRKQQEQKRLAQSGSNGTTSSSSQLIGKTQQPSKKGEREEGPRERARRVAQAEEAWIAQLKARHGEDAWEAVYAQRHAAFEAGLAQSDKVGEKVRENSRIQRERRAAEIERAKEAQAQEKMQEADAGGSSGPEEERRQWRDARDRMILGAELRRPSRPEEERKQRRDARDRMMTGADLRRPSGLEEERKQWRDARDRRMSGADLRRPSRPEAGRRTSFIEPERVDRRSWGEEASF